ncbi:MAG: hypothetical protein GY822_14225 [Deltaproteobacteria bacterium]|nr:hypothetical protein [Deltaproteobacteria bacterium]
MPDPSEKNEPAPTQKIPAEELRELLSHPDAKPVEEPASDSSEEQDG